MPDMIDWMSSFVYRSRGGWLMHTCMKALVVILSNKGLLLLPKHTESEGLPVVQPSTKVTPRVYLGVVYKALSAPFDPLTEAKEQAGYSSGHTMPGMLLSEV